MKKQKRPRPLRGKRKMGTAERAKVNVGQLVSGLPRDKVETILEFVPVKELKRFCKERSIQVDEKGGRQLVIKRILFHLFDVIEEGLMLSNFSKREEEQKEIAEFEKAVRFYQDNRERLIDEYEGKYIAILGEKVIDADKDFGALAQRVYSKHGYRHLFMPKVMRGERTLGVPSPFLAGRS